MSTKDEIRAALEAHQAGVAWFMSNDALDDYLTELTDVIAALLPEETETVEWGMRCAHGLYRPIDSTEAEADVRQTASDALGQGCTQVAILRRTLTTYAPKTTPWEEEV